MPKKISVIVISLVLSVSFVVPAKAQFGWLPRPGIGPDSPFYFLDLLGEKLGMFFAFSAEAKTKKTLAYAEERLAEAKAMADKGKPEETGIAIEGYESYLIFAQEKVREAKEKGKKIEEISTKVAEATSKHFSVLEDVLAKVPEQAKPAITRAKEKSKTGHITALKALAGENPGKAVEINLASIEERLTKAKKEAAEKRGEELEEVLKDYQDFQATLEEVRGKGKVLATLVSQARAKDLEDLDEIEDSAGEISVEAKERVKEVKGYFYGKLMSSLGDLAREDPESATEINLKVAEARLNRAKEKAEEGEIEEMEEALGEFENQHKFGEKISEIAQGLGKDITTVEQLVGKATAIHLEVLSEIYEKVPEQAKEAIEKAMEVSVKGHEKAVEALKKKEALGEVPEEPPLPEIIPEEVKKRIQERVRREIIREEIEEELEEEEVGAEIKEFCEIGKEYKHTALTPVRCRCPEGYKFKVISMGWGPCPKPDMRDCPASKVKCVKESEIEEVEEEEEQELESERPGKIEKPETPAPR
jgi:hypothetical protein